VSASDGPRIMLFGPMDVELQALQRCFHRLSKRRKDTRLERQPFVVSFGGVELFARCAGSLIEFEWTRSAEGWTISWN
jgi:hypothetical protein